MRPPRFSLMMLTILVWVCAILLSCGCGSNLRSQVALRAIADQAKKDCLTVGKKCPDMAKGMDSTCVTARSTCTAALECVQAVSTAENRIQSLQETRAVGGDTMTKTIEAKGSEASARAICKSVGGWNGNLP
jgi:hypothetical protein